MPFAGYDDFDDCVRSNREMDDPQAYCAWLERRAGGKNSTEEAEPVKMRITPVADMATVSRFQDENGDGIDDITGEPVGEIAEEIAEDIAEESTGNVIETDVADGEDFHALLVMEGVWTGDGRWIEEGALGWRELPLPLMATDRTTEGHMDARLIGSITRIERDGREIHGYGRFVESDDAEIMRLQDFVRAGDLRGVSVDLDSVEYEIVVPASEMARMVGPLPGDEINPDPEETANPDEDTDETGMKRDENGNGLFEVEDYKMRVTAARIMGATVVPFPAFEEAFIESMAAMTAALMVRPEVSGTIETWSSLDGIDFRPPQGAREEAERGLAWRTEYGRGGTPVGIARARDIANGKNLSPDTISRMTSFFARHEGNKQAEGWSPGEDGYPSNGRIAWALWGGDPGRAWAEKVRGQIESRRREGSITASAHPIQAPVVPPISWYSDPGLSAPTPMTIDDNGRIYGHLATWETCHRGFTDSCVRPPKSASAYTHFLTGEIVCDDGTRVAVGQITMDTGHAPLYAQGQKAAAHYDDTGLVVADITCGEDRFGIWMAGSLRSDIAPEKIRALMASDVSGDWRRIGSGLELIAILAVNVPGFHKARPQIREAEGLVAALVATLGPGEPRRVSTDRRVVERIAASIGRTADDRRAELRSRVHAGGK
jgi:hypothetical protein